MCDNMLCFIRLRYFYSVKETLTLAFKSKTTDHQFPYGINVYFLLCVRNVKVHSSNESQRAAHIVKHENRKH